MHLFELGETMCEVGDRLNVRVDFAKVPQQLDGLGIGRRLSCCDPCFDPGPDLRDGFCQLDEMLLSRGRLLSALEFKLGCCELSLDSHTPIPGRFCGIEQFTDGSSSGRHGLCVDGGRFADEPLAEFGSDMDLVSLTDSEEQGILFIGRKPLDPVLHARQV